MSNYGWGASNCIAPKYPLKIKNKRRYMNYRAATTIPHSSFLISHCLTGFGAMNILALTRILGV